MSTGARILRANAASIDAWPWREERKENAFILPLLQMHFALPHFSVHLCMDSCHILSLHYSVIFVLAYNTHKILRKQWFYNYGCERTVNIIYEHMHSSTVHEFAVISQAVIVGRVCFAAIRPIAWFQLSNGNRLLCPRLWFCRAK